MLNNILEINNGNNDTDIDSLWSSQIGGCAHVLKSKKDLPRYLGSTNDLRKRFKERNEGKVFSTNVRGHAAFLLKSDDKFRSFAQFTFHPST